MPSLPFTFEDLRNLNVADTKAASDEISASVNPASANGIAAQGFLASKLNQLKDNMSTADGLIDVGMSINPGLRYVDMASRAVAPFGTCFPPSRRRSTGSISSRSQRAPPLRNDGLPAHPRCGQARASQDGQHE